MSRELFEECYRAELSQSTSQILIDSIFAKGDNEQYIHEGIEQICKAWQSAYRKGLDEGWTEGYHLGQVELASYVVEVKNRDARAVSLLEDVLRDHAEWNDEDTRENILLSFSEKLKAATGV